MSDAQVRVLTLNCWGLYLISKKRGERIRAIAERLSDSADQYDVVALQELWMEKDFDLISAAVSHYLPYAKRWYSGILAGPGLVVFSRWPIESAWLYRFPLNGRPSAFWRGDWYVGKSVGSCVIRHPSGRKIEVINAHLHAPYEPCYDCHRAAQAWDMSGIVSRAMSSGNAVFVTGDLNYRPRSIGLRLFELRAQLGDAWVQTQGKLASDQSVSDPEEKDAFVKTSIGQLSPHEQIRIAGVTSDSRLNTWREHYAPERAQRLDYIFFDPRQATAKTCEVVFTEKCEVGSVSDHFGVTASFELKKIGAELHTPSSGAVDEESQIMADLLELIERYLPHARAQAFWRLSYFWVCVVIDIGFLVGVWWGAAVGRAYVGFLFLIVALVLTITGVINGLLGFLFGRHEERSLREFASEVQLAVNTR